MAISHDEATRAIAEGLTEDEKRVLKSVDDEAIGDVISECFAHNDLAAYMFACTMIRAAELLPDGPGAERLAEIKRVAFLAAELAVTGGSDVQ